MFHTDSRYKRDEADKKVDFIVRFFYLPIEHLLAFLLWL